MALAPASWALVPGAFYVQKDCGVVGDDVVDDTNAVVAYLARAVQNPVPGLKSMASPNGPDCGLLIFEATGTNADRIGSVVINSSSSNVIIWVELGPLSANQEFIDHLYVSHQWERHQCRFYWKRHSLHFK